MLVVEADNKVHQRTVTTGAIIGNLEIVSTGLKPGDRIVVEGAQKVQPGMAVQVQQASAQQAAQLPTTSPTGAPPPKQP